MRRFLILVAVLAVASQVVSCAPAPVAAAPMEAPTASTVAKNGFRWCLVAGGAPEVSLIGGGSILHDVFVERCTAVGGCESDPSFVVEVLTNGCNTDTDDWVQAQQGHFTVVIPAQTYIDLALDSDPEHTTAWKRLQIKAIIGADERIQQAKTVTLAELALAAILPNGAFPPQGYASPVAD